MTTTHTVDFAVVHAGLYPGLRKAGQYFCTAQGRSLSKAIARGAANRQRTVSGRRGASSVLRAAIVRSPHRSISTCPQLLWGGMEPRVFDDPLQGPAGGFVRFVAFKMAVPVIRVLLRLARSHHSPQ